MQAIIDKAVDYLKRGELVVLPTESVYGLAADPFNPQARQRWFAAKGRSTRQPYTIHIADSCQVDDWVMALSAPAQALIEAFWPGPLTLILPQANPQQPPSSDDGTIGVRCVDHPLTQEVMRRLGHGLMMSSANRTKQPAPVTAEQAVHSIGSEVAMVVDGGRCSQALSSTIVNLAVQPPQILRQGPIAKQQLEAVLQQRIVMLE